MDGSASKKLRILILDNYAVVRWGVRQILAERFDALEFGEAKAGPEGLDLALGRPWDLVIVTIDLPDREGLEVLTGLKRMRPDQPVLVFLGRVKYRGAVGAVTVGTDGEVGAANNPRERVSAVRRVPPNRTSGQSTTAIRVPDQEPSHRQSTDADLSRREREVLRLMGLGRAVKEIAAVLALSEKTISTYRSRLLIKLGLTTTAALIRYAIANHLSD